jgi:hypothetical protein
MDLIIVVVFIVVLHVSCSFTEHIVSFPLHLSRREREKDNKFLLPSFNPTTFYFSLSLSLSSLLNHTMSFFFSLRTSLRQ